MEAGDSVLSTAPPEKLPLRSCDVATSSPLCSARGGGMLLSKLEMDGSRGGARLLSSDAVVPETRCGCEGEAEGFVAVTAHSG